MGRSMPCYPDQRLGGRAVGIAIAALLAILLLPGANAEANAFTSVEQVFAQAQTVPPCEFSSAELNQAQSTIPNDDQQYEQDLVAAIEQARLERANGACSRRRAIGATVTLPMGTPVPPSASASGPSTLLRLGSTTAATDSGPPAPIVILVILGLLALSGGGALWVARLRGWEPAWAVRVGHSWSEAGYRVSGIWSEFSDWLRLGH
jgi:hypothetical protein